MKYFTLVKYRPCEQLAHLYEHLFVSTITEYLYSHSQYKLLDYSLNGETYESGIAMIYGACYSPKTERLLENIISMKINLSNEKPNYTPVARAISQLCAEESQKLFISDPDMIIRELELLDNKPWRNLDSVDILPKNTTNNKDFTDLIYETDQPADKKPILKLQLQIDNQPVELRVLWRELARLISLSIGQKICRDFGVYYSKESVKNNDTSVMFTSIFSVSPHAQEIDMKEVAAIAKQTLTKVTSSNVLERFSDYLTSLSYTENPYIAPDSCQIAREFGIIIGAAGWEKLATTENIAKALKATHITFRYKNSIITL